MHVKVMNGYEIQSNLPLPDTVYARFEPTLVLLLKSFIRQYYFKVYIQKDWGMTQTQCYERCLAHDIMAFGMYVRSNKYIILSVIGHRALLNFQKYYHVYKSVKGNDVDVFLIFPFTMVLSLDVDWKTECNKCGSLGVYKISTEVYCMIITCPASKLKLTPRDLSFGKLVVSLDDIREYRFSGIDIDELKMKCKHCRRHKPHKICSYDRLSKKIKFIRDQILR